MKKTIYILMVVTVATFVACVPSKKRGEDLLPPQEHELRQVPNCAADGPGCQQFNPNL